MQYQFTKNDKELEKFGCLYPIRGYLQYWYNRNNEAITNIPKDRLLILNTFTIKKNINEIANFLDIPANTIKSDLSHSFQSPKKWDVLSSIK